MTHVGNFGSGLVSLLDEPPAGAVLHGDATHGMSILALAGAEFQPQACVEYAEKVQKEALEYAEKAQKEALELKQAHLKQAKQTSCVLEQVSL